MSVLEVDNIAKSYGGVKAVRGVSFTVAAGELVALIGPNGAGKTTTFNMLNGQITPDSGTIVLDDIDVTGLDPTALWRQGVGRTFQITATFASMTVAENIQAALLSKHSNFGLWGRAHHIARDEAMALLDMIGMRDAADQTCGLLAYGDLKRVELALALANDPRLLFMDEPCAGMAPAERSALMQLVHALTRERGTAVLFTEHDMDMVFAYADRILVMDRGRLIATGSPDEIKANADVRRIYLGNRVYDDAAVRP
jgi:branched-chain amino acid transport system ATP-binding protein